MQPTSWVQILRREFQTIIFLGGEVGPLSNFSYTSFLDVHLNAMDFARLVEAINNKVHLRNITGAVALDSHI